MTPEERLANVKHIVVLMMENRSFDHMLGYLKRANKPGVRGLEGDETNPDPDGNPVAVHAFNVHDTVVQRTGEALKKNLDPSHSKRSVAEQIGTAMDGFVTDYVRTREDPEDFSRELWNVPMGFYTEEALPTYDYLARAYCVCDAWHSSVPGDTWPNRLYALSGRESEQVWLRSGLFRTLTKKRSPLAKLRSVPIYDVPAFTRWLQPGQWRWYSHDPATLRAADDAYRNLKDLKQDNFTWFDRRQMNFVTKALEEDVFDITSPESFVDDAVRQGNDGLRRVSWIDPNFFDVRVFDPHSNDDHPPSDIVAGQQLAYDVYHALRNSPGWQDTVLVITYDEHGGFYDHVPPPAVSDGSYSTLGVRVPALIVGPRVKKGFVCHEAFSEGVGAEDGVEPEAWDHTALIRSILMVCLGDRAQAAIDEMGGRVNQRRAHLGLVLEDGPTEVPDGMPDPEPKLLDWQRRLRPARRAAGPGLRSDAPDGAGQPFILTEFQRDFAAFALAMREAGLPRVRIEPGARPPWYRAIVDWIGALGRLVAFRARRLRRRDDRAVAP